ncbi:hypothetical protein OG897_26275 [Streptomyces sp. NBC_00237]|uniref:hypothetical protein n=1 Tax=Streptomyces sp. NBC_00237 TaxID=2975687 RepID=UPI0022582239|nr:hypothetical protein [Streptomyces sp. NBC_00237]MCX5204949.1 hypothetical protein [Streptomyces sp. NBC_00237]
MKIQERAESANSRVPLPTAPVGERLPSTPRERKPALAALAVLLVLVGALGTTVLVLRAGERIEVVQVKNPVSAGKVIGRDDVQSVLVAEDEAIKYVKYSQVGLLAKHRAVADLVPGTLLIGGMLTTRSGLPAGKAAVGLSLKAGQYPANIEPGATVAVYRVGAKRGSAGGAGAGAGSAAGAGAGAGAGSGSGAAARDAQLVREAKVQDVARPKEGTIGSGALPVSVVVDRADADEVADAAASGEVALVVVPASASSGGGSSGGSSGGSG